MKKLIVTSALPYANGPIHLGHMVEYIQTDIFVRYWRSREREAYYFCADDTHGTPIMIKARDLGITPEALIERIWHEHVRDFKGFEIRFDNYYTTHSEENRSLAIEMFQRLEEGGHIVEKEVEQAYCPNCKTFLPDRFIKGACPRCGAKDQYGDTCEVCSATYSPKDLSDAKCAQCGSSPEWRASNHLFFRLSDFEEQLKEYLRSGHVQEEVAHKMDEWFRDGLRDWDISRDAPYFGFEIPSRKGKYFYVWLDAPIGYMASCLNWCKGDRTLFDSFWRREEEADVYHFIGKDIVYFHALFWPATLMGSGFRTPTRLCVHGFLTINGEKMSKSRGTFITANAYLKRLEPEFLRYYYASKLTSHIEDIDLDGDEFVSKVNGEIVNKIVNIASRVLTIVARDLGGRLGRCDEEGKAMIAKIIGKGEEVAQLYEKLEFAQVIRLIVEIAGEINRYLQEAQPWRFVSSEPVKASTICTNAINAFKVISIFLSPVMPNLARKVANMLGDDEWVWKDIATLIEERTINKFEKLFERIDKKLVEEVIPKPNQSAKTVAPILTLDGLVSCAFDFMRVKSVKDVPETKKLIILKLEDKDGERQVVAGIGQAGLGLENKKVVVLSNLEVKRLRGIDSFGMILAADGGDGYLPIIQGSEEP